MIIKIEETDAKQIEHANHYTTQNKTRKQKNKLSLHVRLGWVSQ